MANSATNASDAIWWQILQLKCKLNHSVANFATNASGTIWWQILQLIQVAPSGGHASNATWWPKLEPMQVALQFGTNASCILLAGEITQGKEPIHWVRCASGNVFQQVCR